MRLRFLAALCCIVSLCTSSLIAAESASEMPPVRHARLSYTCELPSTPADAKSLDLWIPMPQDSERQTVKLLNESDLSAGRITTEKKFGNRLYYRHFDLAAAGASGAVPAKIELIYDVTVHEVSSPQARQLVSTRQPAPPAPPAELAPNL
jgi:hypothetical protein